MTVKEQELYLKALSTWSPERQLRQAQEEAAELIVAINHYLRGKGNGFSEMLEEIADMEIMLGQMRACFSNHPSANEFIAKTKASKLNHLASLLE